jgi:hypothetical protein
MELSKQFKKAKRTIQRFRWIPFFLGCVSLVILLIWKNPNNGNDMINLLRAVMGISILFGVIFFFAFLGDPIFISFPLKGVLALGLGELEEIQFRIKQRGKLITTVFVFSEKEYILANEKFELFSSAGEQSSLLSFDKNMLVGEKNEVLFGTRTLFPCSKEKITVLLKGKIGNLIKMENDLKEFSSS